MRAEAIPEDEPVALEVPCRLHDVQVVCAQGTVGVGEPNEEHPLGVRILRPVRVPDLFEGSDTTTSTPNILTPTMRSTTDYASNPGTAVLPTCSTISTHGPTAASTRERSRAKWEGHRGSYGTTKTGSTIIHRSPANASVSDSNYPAPANHPPYNNLEVQGRLFERKEQNEDH
jgi:hypothetical protein